jgi:hypothetical protein
MNVITNKTNRLLNLGVANGEMLLFNANETLELSDATFKAHLTQITRYVDGDMLQIETLAKKPVVVDSIDAPVVEAVTNTTQTKRKAKRVVKE